MEPDGAILALLVCAGGLALCIVIRQLDIHWEALFLGASFLISFGCIGLGIYWLGYSARLMPGSVLAAGGAVSLSISSAAAFTRRRER